MAKSYNQKLKLLYLIKLFEERTDSSHGITMEEIKNFLLEEHGISSERKSIYDDISHLNEYGFTIDKQKTKDGFMYYHKNRLFNIAECKMIADAVASSRFISSKESEELLEKLKQLVSSRQGRELSRQVYLRERPHSTNNTMMANIDSLNRAINEGVKINFDYYDWNLKKELVKREKGGDRVNISPGFITILDGYYYLVAFDPSKYSETDKGIRHFRIEKMMNIKVLSESRDSRVFDSVKNPGKYVSEMQNMYNGEEDTIVLQASSEKIGLIIDHFGPQAVTIYPIALPDGSIKCRVDVVVSDILYGWLLGVHNQVKLVGPEKRVNEYRKLLESGLKSL